jgi:hypothetical protein
MRSLAHTQLLFQDSQLFKSVCVDLMLRGLRLTSAHRSGFDTSDGKPQVNRRWVPKAVLNVWIVSTPYLLQEFIQEIIAAQLQLCHS